MNRRCSSTDRYSNRCGSSGMKASARLASIGVALDVVAGDRNRTPRRRDDAGEAAQRRRLAGAVRADEPEDLAGADVERDVAHGGEVAVELRQLANGDHRAWVGSRCLDGRSYDRTFTTEWSLTFSWPLRAVDHRRVADHRAGERRVRDRSFPSPTIVSRSCEPSMRLPAPIDTFGPIVDATERHVVLDVHGIDHRRRPAGIDAGRRARPFSSIVRFVSSSVPCSPASYQPSTSITLIFAPWSIMYWNASVR